jgi:hypothetical protein
MEQEKKMEHLPARQLKPEEIRRYNSVITQLLSLFLNFAPDAIVVDTVREISKSCNVSMEFAYAQYLAALCGLDSSGAHKDFFRNYFLPMVHELDPETFEEDAYFRNIKIPAQKSGKWELKTETLQTCEAFVCNDFQVMPDGRMVPQIGFFLRPFSYTAVLENGREWMTLMPNETITTLPAVHEAKGRVLTYGLGLGYFAYMAAEKPEVESVTVVELSGDAISLFEACILPQFAHKEKVKVIRDNAFHFAETRMSEGNYDFVFADIWHDVGDGKDLYLKMKEYEKYSPGTRFTYWLEKTILCYLDKNLWPEVK